MSFTHGRGAFRLDPSNPGEASKYIPLTLKKSGTNLDFTWSAPGGTCYVVDFALYEGDLTMLISSGGYTHDTQVACYQNFTTFQTPLNPPPVGQVFYYLAVSNDWNDEGSFGRDSNGVERPQSLTPCRGSQNLTVCN